MVHPFPFLNDQIKILENNFPDNAFVSSSHTVTVGFDDVKIFYIKPELTAFLGILTMDMNWFVTLVWKEKQPPSKHI
jgi:hypothetical protein